MSKISFKAIVAGGVVDVFLSQVLFAILLAAIALKYGAGHHLSKEELRMMMMDFENTNSLNRVLTIVIGYGCSVLGGYTSARIARHNELLNGALAASLCFALHLINMGMMTHHGSMLRDMMDLFTCPVMGLLGGYICMKTSTHRQMVLGNPADNPTAI